VADASGDQGAEPPDRELLGPAARGDRRRLRRAHRALREYRCEPVRTNVEFLLWALSEPSFVDGSYHTRTIETRFNASLLHQRDEEIDLAAIAATIAAFNYRSTVRYTDAAQGESGDAWRRAARAGATRRWSR
jgi:acetyl/propionyl-CoA carboxylase alpha subunit